MAGYKRAGAQDFVNATTFNSQIVRQREEYQSRPENQSEMGIGSSANIFPDNRQEILSASVDVMNNLDISSELGNPDFVSQIDFSNRLTEDMYNDVSNAVDKPNLKGPNLIAPDINNLTAETANQAPIPEDRQNRGFGWRDERNEPSTPASTIGTYFSRHYNASGNDAVVRPVFGEAKNPETDPNINYNQPQ